MKIIYTELKRNQIVVYSVVTLCLIISCLSIWIAYKALDKSDKILYVVTDKGIVTPLNRIEEKEDKIVVLQGAIAHFIDNYYTLDQFNYKSKSEKVLWLASEDFITMYKDKQTKGYFNRFIQSGVVQKAELVQESLKISSYDSPWNVNYIVAIEVHNGGTTEKYLVENQATLYPVTLNYPYNPFGILYSNFVEGKVVKVD